MKINVYIRNTSNKIGLRNHKEFDDLFNALCRNSLMNGLKLINSRVAYMTKLTWLKLTRDMMSNDPLNAHTKLACRDSRLYPTDINSWEYNIIIIVPIHISSNSLLQVILAPPTLNRFALCPKTDLTNNFLPYFNVLQCAFVLHSPICY